MTSMKGAAVIVTALLGMLAAAFVYAESDQTEQGHSVAAEPPVIGGPPTARLISGAQYTNVIEDVFGPSIAPSVRFAPFRRTEGLLALGARVAGTSAAGVENFESAARTIAARVVDAKHRKFLGCTPAGPYKADDVCARQVIDRYGRLLFRRSLTEAELTDFVATAHGGSDAAKDFYFGLSSSLAGLLVSPEFLFFIEAVEPDPSNPGKVRLTGPSMASRLSLMLWDSGPDGQLLDAANRGELYASEGLRRQVERMMASPRLKTGMRAFFDDMLVFEGFDTLAKDSVIYPAFVQKTAAAAREQTLRTIVDELIVEGGDYRDLFTTSRTFISGDLSQLYRLPTAGPLERWSEYELPPDSGRAGVLTEIAFLALNSHPGRSSPTRRGRALREVFLCQRVPDPPPNVDFSGFEDADHGAKTARGRLAAHSANPVCAGCHRLTDPIGVALENFDSAGQFRDKENGELIDTHSSLDGADFQGAAGLGKVLHDNQAATRCLVNRLYSYGLGYKPSAADHGVLEYLHTRFSAEGYRVVDLLREVTTSKAFYAVTSVAPSAPAKVANVEADASTTR